MVVVCPHCQAPISVADSGDRTRMEVVCDSCGSGFRLDDSGGSTVTLGLDGLGSTVGRFVLLERVGQGAFGTVYKARDPQLERVVALKVPRAGALPDAAQLDRLLREAKSAARLRHPAIVPVHEVGTAGELPYLVSEFVTGVTLADWLTGRRPTFQQAAQWVAAAAHALHYAHTQGVIHRDVKPSNLMIEDGGALRVMDFGLARREAGEVTMTLDGQLLGTPAYMSPEQARGEGHGADARADVYSLGVILYELLTGELPFRGAQRMILHQVLNDEPKPPRKLNDRIPRDLETVCLTAMEKEPGRRYQTATALADDLERWQKGEPIQARPPSRAGRLWRLVVRHRILVGGVTATILALALGLVGVSLALAEARHERGKAEAAGAEALSEAEKARQAERERGRELARTAAALAKLAEQRGRWEEALTHYDTALALGAEDEIGLQLGRLNCRMALAQYVPARAELDELTARPDLGKYAGQILLQRAQFALGLKDVGDPVDLANKALAAGLPPADAAYARVFLAKDVPEAIGHLQETIRINPFHPHSIDVLATLLFITGRKDELRSAVTQLRLVRPESSCLFQCEVLLAAWDRDRAGVERALARLGERGGAEMVPLLRVFADLIDFAQDERFFWEGPPRDKLAGMTLQWVAMAPRLAKMMGDPSAESRQMMDLQFFRLPLFRALADVPWVKDAAAVALKGPEALREKPGEMAELFAALTRTIPDGTLLLLHGIMLETAGRLPESEAVLRRAVEAPSWANHRRRARFELLQVQSRLALDPSRSADERKKWHDQAVTNLRGLAVSGPLPPMPTSYLASVAVNAGEMGLALALVESWLRQAPDDPTALQAKLQIEFTMGLYDRAEATARALLKKRPRLDPAQNLLIVSLFRRGSYVSAWNEATALMKTKPDHPTVADAHDSVRRTLFTDMPLRAALIRHAAELDRARAGDHAGAAAAASRLSADGADGASLYVAAGLLAQASAAVRRDSKLSEAERTRRAEEYAGQAVARLRQALQTDLFRQSGASLEQLPRDANLELLADRADYRALRTQAPPPPDKPAPMPRAAE